MNKQIRKIRTGHKDKAKCVRTPLRRSGPRYRERERERERELSIVTIIHLIIRLFFHRHLAFIYPCMRNGNPEKRILWMNKWLEHVFWRTLITRLSSLPHSLIHLYILSPWLNLIKYNCSNTSVLPSRRHTLLFARCRQQQHKNSVPISCLSRLKQQFFFSFFVLSVSLWCMTFIVYVLLPKIGLYLGVLPSTYSSFYLCIYQAVYTFMHYLSIYLLWYIIVSIMIILW